MENNAINSFKEIYDILLSDDYKKSFKSDINNKKILHIFTYSGLYYHLKNFRLNKSHQDSYKRKSIQASKNSIKAVSEAIKLSKILNELNTNYVYLKGMAFIFISNTDLEKRPMSDIDILIQKDQIVNVVESLLKSGYRFKDEYYVNKMKLKIPYKYISEIQLLSESNVLIELHTNISKKQHRIPDIFEKNMLITKRHINVGELEIPVPDDNHYLLSIVYNYMQHTLMRSGIKFLIDINYFLTYKNIDFNELYPISTRYNLDKVINLYLNSFSRLDKRINFIAINLPDNLIEDSLYCIFTNTFSDKFIFYNERSSIIKKFYIVLSEFLPRKKSLTRHLNISDNIIQLLMYYPLYVYKIIKKLSNRASFFKELNYENFNFDRMNNSKNYFEK